MALVVPQEGQGIWVTFFTKHVLKNIVSDFEINRVTNIQKYPVKLTVNQKRYSEFLLRSIRIKIVEFFPCFFGGLHFES